MSDEEIKAIEKVKDAIRVDKEKRIVTIYDEKPLFRDQLQTLIDLINKQQKEINRLNDENELLKIITKQYNSYCINSNDEPRIILAHKYYFDCGVFASNLISKDKIKEKIKELEDKSDYWNCDEIQVLKELLEEK